jgi:hypothetical protein
MPNDAQGHPCYLKKKMRAAQGHTGVLIHKTRIKFPTQSYRDHQRILRTSPLSFWWRNFQTNGASSF